MIDMPKVEQSLQNGEYTFCNLINAVENEYYFTARECFLKQIQEQGLSVNEQYRLLGECMAAFRSTSGGSGDMCHDFAVYRAAQIHNAELAALLCKGTISGINDVYCLSSDKNITLMTVKIMTVVCSVQIMKLENTAAKTLILQQVCLMSCSISLRN